MASPAKIGIVTVSDRASAGIYADEGGPAILAYMSKALTSPGRRSRASFPTIARASRRR